MLIKTRCLYVLNKEDYDLDFLLNSLSNIPEIFDNFFNIDLNKFKREEILFLKSLPINTVISKGIKENKIYFCLPLFSSHIKCPIKAGEFIWVFPFEENHSNNSLYKINGYWISRVHGLLASEDVNYCYNDRDYLQSFNEKTVEEEIDSINKNPKLKKEYLEGKLFYDKNFAIIPETNMIGSETNRIKIKQYASLLKKPIAQFNFENDDTVIQGSFNNNIVMSKNKQKSSANIDIVVGRNNENKKNIETDNSFLNLSTVKNNTLIKDVATEVNLEEKIIFNGIHFETLKYPEKYIHLKNRKLRFINNQKENFSNDASRIFISELDNIDEKLYDQYSANKSLIDAKSIQNNENIFYSDDKLELKAKSLSLGRQSNYLSDSPCIGLISNEIRIVAKKGSKGLNEYADGSIKLIKASTDIRNQSSITLDNDGQINIDANIIKIGSANKLSSSPLVILGNSDKLNHAVLGDNLKEVLTQLINLNKQSLTIISDFIKADEKHTHKLLLSSLQIVNIPTGSPMPFALVSNSLPIAETQTVTDILNNETSQSNINDESEIQNKLTSLINSLDNILSKLVMNS